MKSPSSDRMAWLCVVGVAVCGVLLASPAVIDAVALHFPVSKRATQEIGGALVGGAVVGGVFVWLEARWEARREQDRAKADRELEHSRRVFTLQATHDHQRADYSRQSFPGIELRRKNFGSAYLVETDLSETDLTDSTFVGANLDNAIMRSSTLVGTNFGSAVLVGADLSGARISGANFLGAALDGARFDNAIFGPERVEFDRVLRGNASFIGAINADGSPFDLSSR